MKQPLKKKDLSKGFSLSAIKDEMGITGSNVDKPLDWIVLPKAYQDATQLPGIPVGYVTVVTGWSNTGKSTLLNCIVASCQKKGIIPVVFDTEGNFDFKYAIDCGMQATPVMGKIVDEETGEEKEGIVNYDGDFFLFNNQAILKYCGKKDYSTGKDKKETRSEPVIEDVAYIINDLLEKQQSGQIPKQFCFLWDSVGSLKSYKSVVSKIGNNMWDAGAMSIQFTSLLNSKIPSSRASEAPYTNTMFIINKIWNDSMNAMPGIPSIELKGGKTLTYGARLIIHVGGVSKAAVKVLKATFKGRDYQYGIISKIKVTKNQLPSPFNVTYQGEVACVHNGLLEPDKLEDYKKNEIPKLMQDLVGNAETVTAEDVKFSEEETDSEI